MSLAVTAIGISLSGCASALANTSVRIKQVNSQNPVIISTYNYEGQKIDQIKTDQVKVNADKNIDSALSVRYGQNRIVHDNNPMLIKQMILLKQKKTPQHFLLSKDQLIL